MKIVKNETVKLTMKDKTKEASTDLHDIPVPVATNTVPPPPTATTSKPPALHTSLMDALCDNCYNALAPRYLI